MLFSLFFCDLSAEKVVNVVNMQDEAFSIDPEYDVIKTNIDKDVILISGKDSIGAEQAVKCYYKESTKQTILSIKNVFYSIADQSLKWSDFLGNTSEVYKTKELDYAFRKKNNAQPKCELLNRYDIYNVADVVKKEYDPKESLEKYMAAQKLSYKVGLSTLCGGVLFSSIGTVLVVAIGADGSPGVRTAGYVMYGISGGCMVASGVSFLCALGYQIEINKAFSIELNAGKIALNF